MTDPSTFQFQMDCMPGYTKFDRTKKVMAMIQIIGDENITPDIDANADHECPELDPAIKSVVAGAVGFDDKGFANDAAKVEFASLGSALKATIDRSNIEFRGRLNAVANWEAYSEIPESRTGHYFPFQLETSATEFILDTEVGKTGRGDSEHDVFVNYANGDGGEGRKQCVVAVDPENPIVGLILKGNGKEAHYTLDFSHVNFR